MRRTWTTIKCKCGGIYSAIADYDESGQMVRNGIRRGSAALPDFDPCDCSDPSPCKTEEGVVFFVESVEWK